MSCKKCGKDFDRLIDHRGQAGLCSNCAKEWGKYYHNVVYHKQLEVGTIRERERIWYEMFAQWLNGKVKTEFVFR